MLAIPILIFLFGAISGKMTPEQQQPMMIAAIVTALIFVLFWFTKLETRVDEAGITIRFFPFQRVYYYTKWEEIESASVRTYKPVMEYGGWGLRYSFRNGKAYSVSGNKGLQLTLKSGKKFLIGTHKTEELSAYLNYLKDNKHIRCIES